jgi:subtilisin family serine protease
MSPRPDRDPYRRLRLWAVLAILALAASLAAATSATAAPAPAASIVVKIDLANGHSVGEITSAYPLVVESTVLASRGIYLLRPTDLRYNDPKKLRELADKVAHSNAVLYAEQNYAIELSDTRFHAWPEGDPVDVGADPAAWLNQPAARRLHLDVVHRTGTGAGQTVAVLDTGVDPTHPALAARLLPGFDYVDDDGAPAETPGGALGHGTFVAGIVALVAPGARIRPYRVLDGEGDGNVFAVSEAIIDAAQSGAGVINLSFGVTGKIESKVVTDAVKQVQKRGVIVIAAAGNDASGEKEFPAAQKEAIGVTALQADNNDLTPFANHGNWIDIAAPGAQIVGPVPGGGYATWAGTSMAAPFVAGQAALLRAAFPRIDRPKLLDKLIKKADRLPGKFPFGAADPLASVGSP